MDDDRPSDAGPVDNGQLVSDDDLVQNSLLMAMQSVQEGTRLSDSTAILTPGAQKPVLTTVPSKQPMTVDDEMADYALLTDAFCGESNEVPPMRKVCQLSDGSYIQAAVEGIMCACI